MSELFDVFKAPVHKSSAREGKRREESPPKRSKNESMMHDDAFCEEIEQVTPATAAESLSLTHEMRHEVAIPLGYECVSLSKHVSLESPARKYPFTLDPFQKLSIACIERNESVLVSAHTSAGKTVVAEYAIATALRDKQRVIYTSPIKALSNQKYRELSESFGDVGLMTGDVTLNPTASCLVMTTEILRSMLYRGSEVMREVAWVIFDEIHYMRDKERGVVWEETLILLPDSVRFVFLSATIPNAKQFARWICQIKSQPCHVVYTNYRPTPLQHYIYPMGAEGIFLAVDEKGIFRQDNFEKALSVFKDEEEAFGNHHRGNKKRTQRGAKGDILKIVKMIMHKNFAPCIIFSFSKRECENLAMQIAKLDFNDDEEKRTIATIFANAIDFLADEDKALPQIEGILPLLKRGIGVHHSGLLPILKEVIEILFQEGLIKVLFATETFSIGLNMPARTVVFTSVRKFDGRDFRWISGGEYIQMSGRAGRRGKDTRGIVILMVEEKMEPAVAKGMLKGHTDPLNSAFHLGYNMILNLMRVEGVSPEYMLERSFFQFQSGDAIPALEAQMNGLMKERDAMVVEEEPAVAEYYQIRKQLEMLREDMRKVIHHPSYALPFLQPGRLVRIRDGEQDYGWGALVNVQKRVPPKHLKNGSDPMHIVDVLVSCGKKLPGMAVAPPAKPSEPAEMLVIPVLPAALDGMSVVRIFIPKDLKPADQRQTVFKTVQEVHRRFPDGLPILDPIADQGIKDDGFRRLVEKVQKLEEKLFAHPLHRAPQLAELFNRYRSKAELIERIDAMNKHICNATAILQMDELKSRKRILRRLGYCDESDVIELKGRVACELSTGDELLLAELMFSGLFNELSAEQLVALLSCFVFEESSDDETKLRDELMAPFTQLKEMARRVAKVSIECNLNVTATEDVMANEEEYVAKFRPELMEVVFAWCKGAKFAKICRMTEIFEGSIIRCMRRLEELLRQLSQAAKSIGNSELENKFEHGIAKLKRDIVFANSLYL